MKKLLSLLVVLCMLLTCTVTVAETVVENVPVAPSGSSMEPPAIPSGEAPAMPSGEAPAMPSGEAPAMPSGEAPAMPSGEAPAMPFGGAGGPGGGMGGQPDSYTAVNTYSEDTTLTNEDITSTGADENAVLTEAGSTVIEGGTITRTSEDSTGGDSASFYGVGAAALVTGGTLTVNGADISTDSAGGAGVFAYGEGTAYVNDCTITTQQGTSGGLHVAGGGTLYASNCTVETNGESSAAIRSDRGGGTMTIDGGSYTANGTGSPAVYVTADITISNAALTATGSEALCLEGKNTVTLNDCTLEGNLADLDQNDNTWTVILYQSMSGDSEVGKGTFTMNGGTLTSRNGGLFYTTNTASEFTLNHVELIASENCEYLLRCTGNANQRGWGTSGSNGADCVFTAIDQSMEGTVIWDSISNLQLSLTEGTVYTGAIVQDESCAGEGGDGTCAVAIDAGSTWVVTGDSYVTSLDSAGTIRDAEGNAVTVADSEGTVITEGTSAYTIYVMGSAE